MQTHKSGNVAKVSGQYAILNLRGRRIAERTIVRGEKFPPTPKSRQKFILVDRTRTN